MDINYSEHGLAPSDFTIDKDTRERPIKTKIWDKPPEGDIEASIRERTSEFLRGEEVPSNIKAMAVLTDELFVKTARQIEEVDRANAMHNGTPFAGKSTVLAMKLYEDKMAIAYSPLPDYGNYSINAVSIPFDHLDSITGHLASQLANEQPETVDTLLSNANGEERGKAKLDLVRYLVKKSPGTIMRSSEGGGFVPNWRIVFAPDGRNSNILLDVNDIPETDPILGESMKLYKACDLYYKTVATIENNEQFEKEYGGMTTEKIENYLEKLPDWAKKVLMGKHADSGIESWKILRFLGKFGYKGNDAQKKHDVVMGLHLSLYAFMDEFRCKIFDTIQKGIEPKEAGLTNEQLDLEFRQDFGIYNAFGSKLPADFSITNIVLDKTPIEDIKI